MTQEDKSNTVIALEALEKAEKAFNEYIDSYGIDPAYFELPKNVKILDSNFNTLKTVKKEMSKNE